MNFSAARSRSAVVTPGRQRPASIARHRATICPDSAIASISSVVLRMIIGSKVSCPDRTVGWGHSFLEFQRCDQRPDLIMDLPRAARRVDSAKDALVLVVADQRRRLLTV